MFYDPGEAPNVHIEDVESDEVYDAMSSEVVSVFDDGSFVYAVIDRMVIWYDTNNNKVPDYVRYGQFVLDEYHPDYLHVYLMPSGDFAIIDRDGSGAHRGIDGGYDNFSQVLYAADFYEKPIYIASSIWE